MSKLQLAAFAVALGCGMAQVATADDRDYDRDKDHARHHWLSRHHEHRLANPRMERGKDSPDNGTGNYHQEDRFAMPDADGRSR